MAKNEFAKRLQQAEREDRLAMERLIRQYDQDVWQIVLHFAFGWDYDQINKATEIVAEQYDAFHAAIEDKPETDYQQEKMDQGMHDICDGHQDVIPFPLRYPELRKVKTVK